MWKLSIACTRLVRTRLYELGNGPRLTVREAFLLVFFLCRGLVPLLPPAF